MTWDDHDIFDGWGSYPPVMQNCEVFQAVWRVGGWAVRRERGAWGQACSQQQGGS